MTNSTSFDLYLEPWLTARVPRMAEYSRQLADFYDWVRTEVDAQAIFDRAERPDITVLVELGAHGGEARLKMRRRVRHARLEEHRRKIDRGVERLRVILSRSTSERHDDGSTFM